MDVRKLVELDLLEPELFLSYWNGELDRFKLEENIKGKLNDNLCFHFLLVLKSAKLEYFLKASSSIKKSSLDWYEKFNSRFLFEANRRIHYADRSF